jgi:hypothetical protein
MVDDVARDPAEELIGAFIVTAKMRECVWM